MTEQTTVFEKYAFFANAKPRHVFTSVLEQMFSTPVGSIEIEYSDRPAESFRSINDRTRKILMSHHDPSFINRLVGEFVHGGSFELRGSTLFITINEEDYNYEIVDMMKNFLSPTFPICVFRNPYIWGANLYDNYERELFFQTRKYAVRSNRLEDPEVDIFRRDDGIVFKLRFHTRNQLEVDEGISILGSIFSQLLESIKKGAFEGLELIFLAAGDLKRLRSFEPRTRMGKDLKAVLQDR